MGIIERLLCAIFPHHYLKRNGTDDIYLRRWFVYPRDKEFKKQEPRLYIHKFYRVDEDAHLHDHPWKYTSLILTGGYWEETPVPSLNKTYVEKELDGWKQHRIVEDVATGEFRRQLFYPRFSLLRRPAEHKHRVVLKDKNPVWTIVLTGVKERSWGFWVNEKLCPWRKYTQGVQWCEEGTEIPEA